MLRPFRRLAHVSVRRASTLAEARRRWNGKLSIAPEVEHALESGAPVVALETAIVTHGMPYPTNLETARSLEAIMRSYGVVPATIALLDGKVHVGLSEAELAALADPATQRAGPAVKVSRRDLAPALALGLAGGTTVAGTMVVAHSVGIGSFVTGGIGGVHRGAESSMDVSADLIELGRTPMMVVCAGAKSILDIPRTLEVLETQGVCVATYGETSDFPAFYSPSSGCTGPWRVDSIGDAARLAHTGMTLPSPQSTLLAVPIPAEYGPRGDEVQTAVGQAVRESFEQGIDKRGKEVTPWLLKRVGELTGGSALELNIKLIENNAHIGAQVAAEVARLRNASGRSSMAMPAFPASNGSCHGASRSTDCHVLPKASKLPPPSVLVFGSAAIDITGTVPHELTARTTTPGAVAISPGGVGRNIAHAAQSHLPPGEVLLVAAVGRGEEDHVDGLGHLLQSSMEEVGLRIDGLVPTPGSTAACSLVLERGGDLAGGVADMAIAETLSAETIASQIEEHRPRLVAFDCNLSPEAINALLSKCAEHSIPTFCDPTSVAKLARLFPALRTHPRALSHFSPNSLELDHLYSYLTDADDDGDAWSFVNALNLGAEWRAGVESLARRTRASWILDHGVATKMIACLPWIGGFWLKAGAGGLLHLGVAKDRPEPAHSTEPSARLTHRIPSGELEGQWLTLTHHAAPTIAPEEIVSTTGAGDTLAGGLVAGLASGTGERAFVAAAIDAVGRTLRSHKAVA